MKSLALTTVVLLLGVLHVSLAQRETSLRVIDALRDLHPAYKELRDLVVNAVAGAKLNSSEVVYRFNVEVAARKESFMKNAIGSEASVLRQLNGQAVTVDTSCLGFLRQSVDVNMNLAGVSFTNCLNNVDASLSSEIALVYAELQVNETSFVNMSVYDVFRGQNVFVNPQTIVDRLVEKLSAMQQAPIELTEELAQLVDAFEGRLGTVQAAYSNCLTLNDNLLQTTLNTALQQLQQICLGALLPAASTSEPTEGTEEPSEPASEPEPETEPATETEPTEAVETEVPSEPQPEPPTPGVAYAHMKALLLLALLTVAISATVADRDETLSLFTQLKRVKKGRTLGTEDDFVSVVQSELLLAEEEYVRSSIDGESSILRDLSNEAAQSSGPQCVDFIREKAGIMLNLAGVSYASCLRRVDDAVYEKLADATGGAVSRDQYDQANVLNAFRGENIFVDPVRIRSKLQQRLRASFKLPALGADTVREIRTELGAVKEEFVECMKVARAGLETTLDATSKQLKLVCEDQQHSPNRNLGCVVQFELKNPKTPPLKAVMRSIIVLLAVAGLAAASRPDTQNVIATFKRIAPIYRSAVDEAQGRITAIKTNVTSQLVNFHLRIINDKEEYVQKVILHEDYILEQIGLQRSADAVCLGFVRSSSEMNVNLAGVSFTNCINAADEQVNARVAEYYGTLGTLEQQVQQLRLLDVFRGHNVFHSPQPIIAKLNAKLALLQANNVTVSADETARLAGNVYEELNAIAFNYNACMRSAHALLDQGLYMCEMQMEQICGAVLPCVGPCPVTDTTESAQMKSVIFVALVVLAAGGVNGGRPGALEVIDTFKNVVPKYLDTINTNEEELVTMERRGSDAIVQFHTDIMLAKETFVLSVTRQEDQLLELLHSQNTSVAAGNCTDFIAIATNENVNLVGVAYTTCVNAADESLNYTATSYYGRIGALEQSLVDLRLLDVFRGDNVFYTPDSILAKLRQKLTALNAQPDKPLSTELEEEVSAFEEDLQGIRGAYIGCMTTAEVSFRGYIELARTQLNVICGGTL
uniref:Protein TsetseEP domain-containing protein n=1 Tax=Anopheles dirus TaxID=7168 RepID=A0A182NTG7_9DIPT